MASLEQLKKEVIEILKRKEKQENKDIQKAIESFEKEERNHSYLEKSITGEWIEKAGYAVGQMRIWRGKKYKKVSTSPSRWVRVYDSHSRGAAISIGKYIAQVNKCKTVEELYQFCMKEKALFKDANGVDLPILDKLKKEIDKKNESLSSQAPSSKETTNAEKEETKPTVNQEALKTEISDYYKEQLSYSKWIAERSVKKLGEKKLKEIADKNMKSDEDWKNELLEKVSEMIKENPQDEEKIKDSMKTAIYFHAVRVLEVDLARKKLDSMSKNIEMKDVPVKDSDMTEAKSIIGGDVARILDGRDVYGNAKQTLQDKIKRRFKTNPAVCRAMLVYIKQEQEKTGKQVFTARNGIWELLPKLNEKAQEAAEKGESETPTGTSGNLYENDNGVSIVENKDWGRYQISFPGKPDGSTISMLKRNGFRWSPSTKTWVCYNGENGERKMKYVAEQLGLNEVKKSFDFSKYLKKSTSFEELKKWAINHLKKQLQDEDVAKSLYLTTLEVIQKAAYPVGTIREWKGKKYIKTAPGKWMRKYDNAGGRGYNQAIKNLMRKIEAAETPEQLYSLIKQNLRRFRDENGKIFPQVKEIYKMAKKQRFVDENGIDLPAEKGNKKGDLSDDARIVLLNLHDRNRDDAQSILSKYIKNTTHETLKRAYEEAYNYLSINDMPKFKDGKIVNELKEEGSKTKVKTDNKKLPSGYVTDLSIEKQGELRKLLKEHFKKEGMSGMDIADAFDNAMDSKISDLEEIINSNNEVKNLLSNSNEDSKGFKLSDIADLKTKGDIKKIKTLDEAKNVIKQIADNYGATEKGRKLLENFMSYNVGGSNSIYDKVYEHFGISYNDIDADFDAAKDKILKLASGQKNVSKEDKKIQQGKDDFAARYRAGIEAEDREYIKQEKAKKKDSSKESSTLKKQQDVFDKFEKTSVKYAGTTERQQLFTKHNYNIDGQDWTMTTDGRMIIAKKEKYQEPEGTKKISNMPSVFIVKGDEIKLPKGIDDVIKNAKTKVVTGTNYKTGKEIKESSFIKFGDDYFDTERLKQIKDLFGTLEGVKIVSAGKGKGYKFEKGDYAVVVMPVIEPDKNRVVNNDVKKSFSEEIQDILKSLKK